MSINTNIEKSLEITTSLVLASIQSGKFEAKDGQAVAEFFDKVFAQVSECANLTSEEFIKKYEESEIAELNQRT